MNIVRAMNPQNMTQLENIALVSGSYNILIKVRVRRCVRCARSRRWQGDAETSSEMWAVAVIGAFQRHMCGAHRCIHDASNAQRDRLKLWVDWHGSL